MNALPLKATNRADKSTGVLTKAEVDELLEFSCKPGVPCKDFAVDYVGQWISRASLQLSILNASNVYPHTQTADPLMLPIPGNFLVVVRVGTNLRNYPPACLANTPTSPALSGAFGPSNLALMSLIVDDSLDVDDVYGVDDTITLNFDQDTDYAGKGPGPWTKTMIDSMIQFNKTIGIDYIGR